MAITWAGTAWATSTAYVLGARVVTSAGNVYQCSQAGTSSNAGSGPTGTGTGITDGSAKWDYVGANTGAVTDVAPELSTTAQAGQITMLALAEKIIADSVWWGDLFDDARRYCAAHLGQLARMRGHGAIVSEKVGDLQRGYAALTGPLAWNLTSAGEMFLALVRLTPAGLGAVSG